MKHLVTKLGVDLDFQDADGLTVLHHAALSGYEDTTQELLIQGAHINARTKAGATALFLAAFHGYDDIVSLLLRSRASMRPTSEEHASALHYACCSGSIPTVSLLKQKGADLNGWGTLEVGKHQARDCLLSSRMNHLLGEVFSYQPLHVAICNSHLDVATYLIEHGADVNAVMSSCPYPPPGVIPGTALHLVVELGCDESAAACWPSKGRGTRVSERQRLALLKHLRAHGAQMITEYNSGSQSVLGLPLTITVPTTTRPFKSFSTVG